MFQHDLVAVAVIKAASPKKAADTVATQKEKMTHDHQANKK